MVSGVGFLSAEAMASGAGFLSARQWRARWDFCPQRRWRVDVKGVQGVVVKKAPRFVRVLGFRHSTGILNPGEVSVVPERARMWKARREVEELRRLTTQDVASYVSLCGDTNPIHICDSAAQSAGFQGRVVQGMLYAGLFPAIIGSHFDGVVYVSQTFNFKSPVLVGEALCAEVEVIAVKKLRHHYRVTFATHCYKKGDPTVVVGREAVALLPA